jgi:hypothetical protein
MESDSLPDTNISVNAASKQELANQKAFIEEIYRNTKELENFLNLNQKLRGSINEMVNSFLNNNEERKNKI